jgi:F-type H+-transporting ATPase subunit g
LKTLRNPSSFFTRTSKEVGDSNIPSILNRVRNINAAQLAASGVIFAEILGFFTVGEMIGRMKIVGYRGEKKGHH